MQNTLFEIDNEEKIGQENEVDINQLDPQSVSEAVLWGTDWTTETLVSQMKKQNIDLSPSFQRRDAWGIGRKSSFIESIIVGFPIPQVILAERKDKKGAYIVIDGKQRLLSIRQFCSVEDNDEFQPLFLKDLSILTSLNRMSYRDIQNDPDLSEIQTVFDNQTIRTVIIKNWPNEDFLYSIFLRLNTGGLPLSPQELRQALNPGFFTAFADEYSLNSVQVKLALGISKPDYRMRDVEIVVRYFAFRNFILEYSGNLKDFLDSACQRLNSEWISDSSWIKEQAQDLDFAIETTFEIFKGDAFSKYSDGKFIGIFNRPVYDIMTFYFSNREVAKAAVQASDQVIDGFKNLCSENIEFLRSLETSTKNMDPTAIRFNAWGTFLRELTGVKFPVPVRTLGGLSFE